ncbi:hypothetical protein TCEA9_18680 [Thermobrachium celere]|nr:hypothetical protein TCEA9_18680 [Thermobrachium celere]
MSYTILFTPFTSFTILVHLFAQKNTLNVPLKFYIILCYLYLLKESTFFNRQIRKVLSILPV